MFSILYIPVYYILLYIYIYVMLQHAWASPLLSNPPPPPPQVLPSLVVASITSDQCSVYYIFLYVIYIYIYICDLDEISLLCYSMHGPAHCCPHPRVLPNLVGVHITSGQYSIYYIFLYDIYIYYPDDNITVMLQHAWASPLLSTPQGPAQSGRCLSRSHLQLL